MNGQSLTPSDVPIVAEMTLDQVPPAVRATIEKEARGATIEDVEREDEGGKVIYEVELERDNVEWKLKIDESGKVIQRKRDT